MFHRSIIIISFIIPSINLFLKPTKDKMIERHKDVTIRDRKH